MGGSGLQWSFSGKPGNPPQILSFKPASEGGSHSIYPPSFVQKVGSAEKSAVSSLVNRQSQNYGALVNNSREVLNVSAAKTGQLVASPLNSSPPVVSNSLNGVGCRVHPGSLGSSAYKVPSGSVPPLPSAVVGSTNLRSGESSYNGPSQMTIFYNGLVCVYDDVAPDKAQAIMLLAGNGNSRSQKPAESGAKTQPRVVLNPPAAMEVTCANPSSNLPKPIPLAPLSADLSGSSSSKASETSSGISKAAPSAPRNDPVPAGTCTNTVEVNPRNTASKFQTPTAGIRLSQSAMPVDKVSNGASTSTVEVHPRIPALKYSSPTPGSPGTSRFRFSQSAIPMDPVLAAASVSKVESPKQQAPKFPPPTTVSTGPNQICFSQSVSARTSTGRIEASSHHPLPSNQIRFSQSATPIDPVSAGAASAATIEARPRNPATNFTLPATVSAASNQIRFSRSAIPIEPVTAGAPISIVESNPIKPTTTTNSVSNQFRFPQSATAIDSASGGASKSIVESNPIIPAPKFPDPATGTGSSQFRFSQSSLAPLSYMDRSLSSSSPSDLKKPNSAAAPIDRASPGASSSPVESSAAKPAPKLPTPAKGAGGPNQLRFSQSGVPLARKASLARFLEKRKERPSGDVGSLDDIPPSKFRANSR